MITCRYFGMIVWIFFSLDVDIVHHDTINLTNALENGVSEVLQPNVVYVDVGKEFDTKREFTSHEHMLK